MRQYTGEFEPSAGQPFDDLWERKLTSVQQVKGEFLVFFFCKGLPVGFWYIFFSLIYRCWLVEEALLNGLRN